MRDKYFDYIYYVALCTGIEITPEFYKQICDCEDEIDSNDNAITRSKLFVKFCNEHSLTNMTAVNASKKWAAKIHMRDSFYSYIKSIANSLKKLEFTDDNISSYNELLDRVVRSKGHYIDVSYRMKQEDVVDENDVTPVANELIEKFNAIKNKDITLRDILDIYYAFPYFKKITEDVQANNSPFKSYKEALIVCDVLKAINDVTRIDLDETTEMFKVMIDRYETDEQFLTKLEPAIKDIKVGNITMQNIFDVNNIKTSLQFIITNFDTDNRIVEDVLQRQLGSQNFEGIEPLKDEPETYQDVRSLIESALNPEYSPNLKKIKLDAVQAIANVLKSIAEYISTLDNDVKKYYINLTEETIKANRLAIPLAEAIAKWKGFLNSNLYETGFKHDLDEDIIKNVAPSAFEKLVNDEDKRLAKCLNKDVAMDVITIIKKVNFDDKRSVPEKLFAYETTTPRFDDEVVHWKALVQYLLFVLATDFNEKATLEMSKTIRKSFYDAACVVVYVLTSEYAKNITVSGGRRVAESSYNRYDDIMLFEKTVIMKQFADMTQVFNKVYKNFKSIIDDKKTFKDFVKQVWDSFKEVKQDEQQPTADTSVAPADNTTQQLADEVKQAVADVEKGK